MKVYKVFDNYGGKLTSAGTIYPHEITYDIERVNRHQNMFVFGSEEAARSWVTNPLLTALWECETSHASPAPPMILRAWDINQFFEEYWDNVLTGLDDWMLNTLQQPPEGTVLVDDLRLIREIQL